MRASILCCLLVTSVKAFVPPSLLRRQNGAAVATAAFTTKLHMAAKVGIFFGTSTGSTQEVADLIKEGFGDEADGPFDIDSLQGSVADKFAAFDALVVGTPTWNTGADTERSGTGWDEVYYGEMQDLSISGKKVAVFGLGDSVSYAENYADASGELHDVFEGLGCKMIGYTSQEGYVHEASKAIRGDLFCGLLCDMVNQEELTEERVANWVAQLRTEGILEGGPSGAAPVPEPAVEVAAVLVENEAAPELEEHSRLLDESISAYGTDSSGFIPHYNPKTKSTMWTSPDGRTCYYTVDTAKSTRMNFSP